MWVTFLFTLNPAFWPLLKKKFDFFCEIYKCKVYLSNSKIYFPINNKYLSIKFNTMNTKKIMECERERLSKVTNFRLSHTFWTIGMAIAALAILTMLIRAFAMEGNTEWLREFAKKGLLVGMLLMSISKDKEEDELTIKLRMQSYAFAFVVGVVYALVMPYIEFGVSNVVKSGGEAFKNLGDFQVLIFMLLVQLMSFHTLKRYR